MLSHQYFPAKDMVYYFGQFHFISNTPSRCRRMRRLVTWTVYTINPSFIYRIKRYFRNYVVNDTGYQRNLTDRSWLCLYCKDEPRKFSMLSCPSTMFTNFPINPVTRQSLLRHWMYAKLVNTKKCTSSSFQLSYYTMVTV
jgi:hypothetical protein